MGESLAIMLVFSIPLVAIITGHKRKMLELQLRARNEVDHGARANIDALRDEVRQLRETSMQYDMSFDTALQNMEKRVASIERRMSQQELNQTPLDINIGR